MVRAVCLTIAGSDPSGGAGIQADLKTFSRLGVYGMTIIAAMTAQNTVGVTAVLEVPPSFIEQQLDAVLSDIRPDAVKTGMLLTEGAVESVARKLKQYKTANLVVDPVMASSSGAALLHSDASAALRRELLPLARVITPNLDEAAALTGRTVRTVEDMEAAARHIFDMGPRYVLVKGGHLEGDEAIDILFDGARILRLRAARIATAGAHGTGCVLSASIAAYLSLGHPVEKAVELAKELVGAAIRNRLQLGSGLGPCDPLSFRG